MFSGRRFNWPSRMGFPGRCIVAVSQAILCDLPDPICRFLRIASCYSKRHLPWKLLVPVLPSVADVGDRVWCSFAAF